MEMENNIRLDSLTREELEALYVDTVRKNNVEREELQSKTEELSELVETIPLGIYIYRTKKNGSTQFDYLSERCIDLLGLEQAGIDLQSILEDGRNLFKTVHPDDFDGFVKTSNSAIQSLEQYSWEGRFIVNGKIRWIRAESLPSLQPNGDVLWNGFVTDISERKAIELSVRKERDRAQNYLDAVETIIIVLDVRGNVTTINRKGCQILGYSEEEMLGALWFQKCLPQPEGMEKNYPDFLEMISSCKDLDLRLEFSENPVITRSGNLRQIAWHNILLRDNESRLIGIVCSGEDITDRRQAEEEILKSKIFSESIINSLPGIFYVLDETGKFYRVNNRFTKVSGYSEEEVYGMHPLDFFSEGEKKLIAERITTVFEKGEASVEADFLCKDGTKLPYFFTGYLTTIDRVPLLVGVGMDISARKQTERELRESEEKFRELFEKSGDAILIIENETFVDCNEATVKMLGYKTKEEFLYLHPSKLSPEFQPDGKKSAKKADEMMETAIQKGTHRFEWDHVRKSGEIFPVEVLLTAISNNPEKRIIHTVWRDITERKKSEKSLFLRMQIESLSAEIFADFISSPISETDRLVVEALRKIAEIAGGSRAAIFRISSESDSLRISHEWRNSDAEEHSAKLPKIPFEESGIFQRKLLNDEMIIISGLSDLPDEIRNSSELMKDFNFHSFIFIPIVVQGKSRSVIGVCGGRDKVVDWTLEYVDLLKYIGPIILSALDRRETANALAAEKERLAITLRSIGDGVITTDTLGNILLMNNVAEELCGWPQEEAAGVPLSDVLHIIHELTREPCENPVRKILKSGEIVELEDHTILISRDGTERIISDSGAPIRDAGGGIIGVVLVFRDVTEKQKMQETIQRSVKLDSLGILAGGIAHDFNNLLGGIYGNIDLALERSIDTQAVTYLNKAVNTIDRAKGLTSQLLTFAKGGAPVRQVSSLFPFLKETALFALSGSNVSCLFQIEDGLWQCNIDKNQIGQVIDNIVINAQQAMPDGGKIVVIAKNIRIAEKEHSALEKGDYVKISFRDFGCGIPKETISRIFDPYYTTKTKGHGLGLATCYSIISRHGGFIDVESEAGKGTTFHMYLPACNEILNNEIVQADNKLIGAGTILILEDEEILRDMMTYMIQSLGYSVVCKENGTDAIEYFLNDLQKEKKISGMIFDITIPGGMGGKEAIREIRKLNLEIPVFVASGYAEDPVMANPAEYGFTASISKPFTKRSLSEMLARYIK